jgi:hypothetical protein
MSELIHDDLVYAVNMMPKHLRLMMKQYPRQMVIAGGYVRDRVLGEKPSDIDVFAPDRQVAKEWGVDLVAHCGVDKLIETKNAYTVKTPLPIQIIHRWTFARPEDVVWSFDFTIAKAAFWYDDTVAREKGHEAHGWVSMVDPQFYPDLAAKRLRYTSPIRNEDAGGSLLRVLKFYQRGYRIPLDSLGATMARLAKGASVSPIRDSEEHIAKIYTGLLREVDPNHDPEQMAYRLSTTDSDLTETYAQSNQV